MFQGRNLPAHCSARPCVPKHCSQLELSPSWQGHLPPSHKPIRARSCPPPHPGTGAWHPGELRKPQESPGPEWRPGSDTVHAGPVSAPSSSPHQGSSLPRIRSLPSAGATYIPWHPPRQACMAVVAMESRQRVLTPLQGTPGFTHKREKEGVKSPKTAASAAANSSADRTEGQEISPAPQGPAL